MFREIDRLEKLLGQMIVLAKRADARQSVRAEDIHLGDGASLNITMNNILLSTDSLAECMDVVQKIKDVIPRNGQGLLESVRKYRAALIERALSENGYNVKRAARSLSCTEKQIRYRITGTKEVQTCGD